MSKDIVETENIASLPIKLSILYTNLFEEKVQDNGLSIDKYSLKFSYDHYFSYHIFKLCDRFRLMNESGLT